MSAASLPRPRPRGAVVPRPRPPQRPTSARASARRRVSARVLAVVVLAGLVTAGLLVFRGGVHAATSAPSTAVPGISAGTPLAGSTASTSPPGAAASSTPDVATGGTGDGIKIATFLGGSLRRSYGIGPAPSRLGLIWRVLLGSGQTQRKIDNKLVWWAGSGWTGQCTVVRDKGRDYLLIGGYDHNLHKIDALTGKVVWQCPFDDVIKSTNTVIANPHPTGDADRLIVVAGSRRGFAFNTGDPRIAPLRAVSFTTGKELWRLPIPKTINYSQDVDSSPLLYEGVLYAAVEPGYVYGIDPFHWHQVGDHREPTVLKRSQQLFTAADAKAHPDLGQANVAVEASPSRVGDTLYIACGAGRIYGLKLPGLEVVWDFHTGTDLDGSTVWGSDGVLMQAVEKQYTTRPGGIYGLDPTKPPASAPLWYFPTLDRGIAEWKAGVIGSVAVNDESDRDGRYPRLAAFVSVDGYVRVIARDAYIGKTVLGPGVVGPLKTPVEVFRGSVGAGISTPIIVGDALVAAGYDHTVHLYRIKYRASSAGAPGALRSPSGQYWTVSVTQTSTYKAGNSFESTPIVWGGRVYIGCRDGYLYCLGTR
jgi:outer membrane protein assembly factor BamB